VSATAAGTRATVSCGRRDSRLVRPAVLLGAFVVMAGLNKINPHAAPSGRYAGEIEARRFLSSAQRPAVLNEKVSLRYSAQGCSLDIKQKECFLFGG